MALKKTSSKHKQLQFSITFVKEDVDDQILKKVSAGGTKQDRN